MGAGHGGLPQDEASLPRGHRREPARGDPGNGGQGLPGAGDSRLRASRLPPHAQAEEHTSELQSLTNLVCRLLLEKKNIEKTNLSKQEQVSEINRQMLTQAQTTGAYFTNDQ